MALHPGTSPLLQVGYMAYGHTHDLDELQDDGAVQWLTGAVHCS